jgi:hypothetical protein
MTVRFTAKCRRFESSGRDFETLVVVFAICAIIWPVAEPHFDQRAAWTSGLPLGHFFPQAALCPRRTSLRYIKVVCKGASTIRFAAPADVLTPLKPPGEAIVILDGCGCYETGIFLDESTRR